MGAAEAGAAVAPDRIDLVDENDARAIALGLLEQIAYAAGAHANEHLHEFRAADAEKGHSGLAGNGLGHQSLAGAGWPNQEYALGDARTQRHELLRLLEEFNNLLQFLLGFIGSGDIAERNGRPVADEHAGFALAEGEGLVVAALALAEEKEKKAGDQEEREEVDDQSKPVARIRRRLHVDLYLGQTFFRDAHALQGPGQGDALFFAAGQRLITVVRVDLESLSADVDAGHLATPDLSGNAAQANVLGRFAGAVYVKKQGRGGNQYQQIDKGVSRPISGHNLSSSRA